MYLFAGPATWSFLRALFTDALHSNYSRFRFRSRIADKGWGARLVSYKSSAFLTRPDLAFMQAIDGEYDTVCCVDVPLALLRCQ